MSQREGYMHDFLVASLLGVGLGIAMAVPASIVLTTGAGVDVFGRAIGPNWGPYIGGLAIAGIFGFTPGGLIAGYINFRFHRMGDNLEMAGLSAGFFTAFVFMILELVTALTYAILNTGAAGTIFIGWALTVVFGFIFFTAGGYLSGMLERRPFAMPAMFDLSKLSRGPPPPPAGTTRMCSTCGQPMTFVEQYGRWFCPNCKKYA